MEHFESYPWLDVACHFGLSRVAPRAHGLALAILPLSLRVCGMGAAPPSPPRLTGKTHAAQDGLDITCGSAVLMLGVPPREIDISWVSLCVPLRPGKNSFVMMRWVRYRVRVSRRSGRDRGAGRLHIAK